MKVSVIMSVYNGEKYLRESISSILQQTYTNFEFIIANDCSTDNSEEIIYSFMKKDTRIKYIKNKSNLGLTKNLNKMVTLSKGDLIARMDSDDIALENRFAEQVRVFKECKDLDVVFTNAIIIDNESKEVCKSWRPKACKDIIKLMPMFNYIIHPSTMISRQVFDKVGLYNELCITGQDKDLWLRIINNKGKFYYLDEKLLKYRINPNSVRSKIAVNYSYKLAKVCVANKSKIKALSYLKALNTKEKVDILTRCMFPFDIYRRMLYTKNSITE